MTRLTPKECLLPIFRSLDEIKKRSKELAAAIDESGEVLCEIEDEPSVVEHVVNAAKRAAR